MANVISVGTLNEQIKTLVESTFEFVSVEGELSRVTYHNSGHLYFSIKDSESMLKCVMFKGNAARLKFRLEEGMHIVLHGAISLYKPRGEYQLNVVSAEPYGAGALALAYEQMKKELAGFGYFDESRKKPLPKFPNRVALVTSATGAALQDMIRVANTRWQLCEFVVYDTLVQGDEAAAMIASILKSIDSVGYDAIILARGGGSIEDLWAFNERVVADALFNMQTPTISAIGHEIDWVISDFVADVRAATPSAAMQILLPDKNELMQYLDDLSDRYYYAINQILSKKLEQLEYLRESFVKNNISHKLKIQSEQLLELKSRFNQAITQKLDSYELLLPQLKERLNQSINTLVSNKIKELEMIKNSLLSQNPKNKSARGYAQITKGKKVIELNELNVDDIFLAINDKYKITSKVLEKELIS